MFAKSNTGRLSNNSSIPVPKKKSFTKTKPVPEDRTNRDKLILVDRKPALADRTPVLADRTSVLVDRTSVLVDRTNKLPNVDTINKEPNVDKATPFKKVSFTDIPDFTFSTPRRKELNLGTPIRIPKTPQNKPVVNITPKINNKVALQLGKILMDNE